MDNPKSGFDPRDREIKSANAGGVRVPVKGDSSSGEVRPESGSTSSSDSLKIPRDPDATWVDADVTLAGDIPPPTSGRRLSRVPVSAAILEPGDVLGGRYEIQQLLGEGGMGAVYKAQDRELDRPVALKVIRPELAASPAILARFKQELLLAHQVTHKNVIRIYDLGDADGVKFITMEFV